MSNNVISKDELLEPFNIISEFQVKNIGELDNYVSSISKEIERLNGLDFDPEFKRLMDFGKAISNDIRLKILYFMNRVTRTCFCELENVFNLKQSTLNYHINLLKRANLVETYKEGKLIVLQLTNVFDKLIDLSLFEIFKEENSSTS